MSIQAVESNAGTAASCPGQRTPFDTSSKSRRGSQEARENTLLHSMLRSSVKGRLTGGSLTPAATPGGASVAGERASVRVGTDLSCSESL